MHIDFTKLNFTFSQKPLVIGGKAMEYYGLRQAGNDIDLVVPKEDLVELMKQYPTYLKDLGGDMGVAIHGFEIWKSINYFDYRNLSENAIEEAAYLVISLEKLLVQRALAMHKPKYYKDLELVVQKIIDEQLHYSDQMMQENEQMLSRLENVAFVEKK